MTLINGAAIAAPAQPQTKAPETSRRTSYDVDRYSPAGLPVEQLSYQISSKNSVAARKLLDRTARRPGDQNERLLWSAACESVEQRYDEAVSSYERAKDKTQMPSYVTLRIARAYAEENKFDQAIDLLTKLLSRKKLDDAYALRASCYSSKKNNLAAAKDYEVVATITPQYRGSFLLKAGKAYFSADQTQIALEKYNEAEKTERTSFLYLARSECYKKLKQWTKAIEDLNRAETIALKNGKNKPEYQFMVPTCCKDRALCYGMLGDKVKQQIELKRFEKFSREVELELLDSK